MRIRQSILILLLGIISNELFGQVLIKGKVVEREKYMPLSGVNIFYSKENEDQFIGVVTNESGEFQFTYFDKFPVLLNVTYLGYESLQVEIGENNSNNLLFVLDRSDKVLNEVVVTTNQIDSVVFTHIGSIQKLDLINIIEIPSFDYYDAIATMKEVDFATQSILFKSVNTRGFNSGGNARFIQIVDGMDNQAPGFNFSFGNFSSPIQLDIESMEIQPGVQSIRYGPNALNGALNIRTKDIFEYEGIQANAKIGFNHFVEGGGGKTFFDFGGSPMIETAIRLNKVVGKRLALKISGFYLKTRDWEANDFVNIGAGEHYEQNAENPGYNGLNLYGDEILNFLSLSGNEGLVQVNRTGYKEKDLVDYNTYNLKVFPQIAFRINDFIRIDIGDSYTIGTTLFTGENRIQLNDFALNQFYINTTLKNKYALKYYQTNQYSGRSYDVGLLATNLVRWAKSDEDWFKHYKVGYEGNPVFNIPYGSRDHAKAREFADSQFNAFVNDNYDRLEPGTDEYEEWKYYFQNTLIKDGGSRFIDNSALHHLEFQAHFDRVITESAQLDVGTSYRLYRPKTFGSVFADTVGNELSMYEMALFAIYNLPLGTSLTLQPKFRIDKNQSFNAVVSPGISLVKKLRKDESFSVSIQSGYRNPTLREQKINLNYGNKILIGGDIDLINFYHLPSKTINYRSVNTFRQSMNKLTDPEITAYYYGVDQALLENAFIVQNGIIGDEYFGGIRPESIYSVEGTYRKNMMDGKLYLDINYYFNWYKNMIGFVEMVRTQTSPITDLFLSSYQTLNAAQSDRFAMYANSQSDLQSQGVNLLIDYMSKEYFNLVFNASWNKLYQNESDPFTPGFNTPEWRFNFSVGNRQLVKNFGVKYSLRMRTAFRWESNYFTGDLPAYSVNDIQFNLNLPELLSEVRIGYSNIGNKYYTNVYGGPQIGAILYLTATYNGL